ncbi:SucC2 [Desulfamplus magnetovallimortis]|uniref:SucC2 n=1 Tax=Desulfamplus magnetovallimortis TaxID=1246637 RepID=L0R739_9BACT|nr:acetate--CoA ligase [Desulfamplus magnetovallimortis]CCO06781.1 SucC2 [Desulfamplus magnetovallimortis BW-1]SLM32832.1 SucC2 [Desulfamplus magnetovallimortis]
MLKKLLDATSVAIIGASKNPTKRGYQAIKTLQEEGYEGDIFPVNPKEDVILGLKCHESVSAIPQSVDLALITTPARTIPSLLKECGEKGIAGAVIIAGGFRELGEHGQELENEMLVSAKKYGVRLIGPNTSGMINMKSNMNLVGIKNAPKGNIALLCQSGNMALTLITEAMIRKHEGFTYYVGVGNESDIKFHEYLDYFSNDPATKSILMYVEGMSNGREFLQQAYQTTTKKPIILLKSGRSDSGKKSAGSHTGSLAGMSEVAKAAFERAGIIVIENSDELFPVAETLSSQPPIKNNSVAILADGGGHATIAADLLSDYGIKLPNLTSQTQKKLKEILPNAASVVNPVDVAGGTDSDPSIFADCARILLKDPNVGGLLIVGLFGGYGIRFDKSLTFAEEEAAHRLGKMVKTKNKPIVMHSLYSSYNSHPIQLLGYYDIPVNDSLDISCKCIAALCEYGDTLTSYQAKTNFLFNWGAKAKKSGVDIINKARSENRRVLLEHEAKQLIKMHGAPVCGDTVAESEEQAVKMANSINGKVVLKIVSPDILHKSDAGGVKVDLETEEDVRSAYQKIIENAKNYNPDADIRGVLVSPMVTSGLEVIIGTKIDDLFGPVIMYGLGGIMVEIMKDVTFWVLPISERSARKMIEKTRSSVILDGVRGQPGYDKKALKKLLLICSELIESYPEIEEMDLNPVILNHQGVNVVDARIILKK